MCYLRSGRRDANIKQNNLNDDNNNCKTMLSLVVHT